MGNTQQKPANPPPKNVVQNSQNKIKTKPKRDSVRLHNKKNGFYAVDLVEGNYYIIKVYINKKATQISAKYHPGLGENKRVPGFFNGRKMFTLNDLVPNAKIYLNQKK